MDVDARNLLRRIVSCLDLTSLEDSDTEEGIAGLCRRAVRPDLGDASVPAVAAVCVYPRFASFVRDRLVGTGVRAAVAAGAFPDGRAPLEVRLREIRHAIDDGADEIDTVLDHEALLAGHEEQVRASLLVSREACSGKTMKVILETGALGSDEAIRRAGRISMESGADFVKSSTGKAAPGVTPEAARAMMEAARDFRAETGRSIGVKLAGGIRSAEQALGYAAMLREVLGEEPAPDLFRIGASSLLDELVAAIARADRPGGAQDA